MKNWLFVLIQASRQLWVRVAAYSVLGLLAAGVAAVFSHLVPLDLALTIGTDAVDQVLSILASSMLAVATFSLATLVSAYTAVAATATPRAAKLMVSDGRGQGSLATFVGAFIYAVVGIFVLQTGYYGAQGRVILFFTTLGVLFTVLTALIRWIAQLSLLGQVDEAVDRVRSVTEGALAKRSGAERPATADDRAGVALRSDETGYVQAVDLGRLESLSGELGVSLWVEAMPGAFVHAAQPLLRFSGRANLGTGDVGRIKSAFVIGERRTFDQDPRYGLTVLGQIGAKALSPGVNDPGTASDVIATGVGVLTRWSRGRVQNKGAPALQGVGFAPLHSDDLLRDLFGPIDQYGAGDPEIGVEIQTALAALAAIEDPDLAAAARRRSSLALQRALETLSLDHDRERVSEAARQLADARR